MEATAAEPQEDELGSSRLPACVSSLLPASPNASSSALPASANSSLLLASASSSLLAGTSGLLVEELLAAGSLLLASTSGLFLNETEAMVLVRPQFVNGPLPSPVRAVRARVSTSKNGPPVWRRRQQSGSPLVFTGGSLKPIFANWLTKGVQGGGVVAFVVVEQPPGGAWGGLRTLNMQSRGRIGEVGRGQMSRRGSTVPHLWRIREGISAHLSQFRRGRYDRTEKNK